MTSVRRRAVLIVITVLGVISALGFVIDPLSLWSAQDALPSYLEHKPVPAAKYHLTARPWQPMGVEHYLDVVEGLARW